jgi:hypothetical protein
MLKTPFHIVTSKPDFIIPEWDWYYRAYSPKWEEITEQKLAEWEQQSVAIDKHNEDAYAAYYKAFETARITLLSFFSTGTKEYKYLTNNTHLPSYNRPVKFEYFLNKYKKYKEDIETAERNKKSEEELKQLKNEAIQWLLDRGKRIGEDFTIENALYIANGIALDEEIERKIADIKNSPLGTIDIDDNFCECETWDGESKRCNCGNRRMNWTSGWDHTFKHPIAIPEPY